MFSRGNRSIRITRIQKTTGDPDVQSKKSKYVCILDEDIILERALREGQSVAVFVHDEFMEFMMARALIHKFSGSNLTNIISRLAQILRKAKKWPTFLGVVGYAAIILREEYNLSVWDQLVKVSPEWHLTAVRSCSQLDEKYWDDSVFIAVATMTNAATKARDYSLNAELFRFLQQLSDVVPRKSIPIWGIWLKQGASELRIASAKTLALLANQGNAEAIRELELAVSVKAPDVSGTTTYAIGTLNDNIAVDMLVRNQTHTDPATRQAVAYGLGLFNPSQSSRACLGRLMKDKSKEVSMTALSSIMLDGDESVTNIIIPQKSIEIIRKTGFLNNMLLIWKDIHGLQLMAGKMEPFFQDGYAEHWTLNVLKIMRSQSDAAHWKVSDALVNRLNTWILTGEKTIGF